MAEFHDDNDAARGPVTSYRSGIDGRRAFLVGKPLRLFWSALTNDISVFVLFLPVSVLNYRHHISLRRSDEIYSSSVPGAYWLVVLDWPAPPDTRKHYWSPATTSFNAGRTHEVCSVRTCPLLLGC